MSIEQALHHLQDVAGPFVVSLNLHWVDGGRWRAEMQLDSFEHPVREIASEGHSLTEACVALAQKIERENGEDPTVIAFSRPRPQLVVIPTTGGAT